MIALIVFFITLAIIDTLIGNRLFPGRVEVQVSNEHLSWYVVVKYHRIFFVPVRWYLQYESADRDWSDFTISWFNAEHFKSKDKAINYAKIYSNKEDNQSKVVWSSRKSKKSTLSESLPNAQELVDHAERLAATADDEEKLKILEVSAIPATKKVVQQRENDNWQFAHYPESVSTRR